MRRVLFDTNVILDVALKRELFFQEAAELFLLIDAEKISGQITATTVTDIYYISRKEMGHESSINFIVDLIKIVEVIGIDKAIILSAFQSKIVNLEDATQEEASLNNYVDTIITRNKKDFKGMIKVLTPKEFLSELK
jgi:predicted nucleic acid-binding protein